MGATTMHEQEPTQLPAASDDVAVLPRPPAPELPEDDAELEELLIREITIDGMCGVY